MKYTRHKRNDCLKQAIAAPVKGGSIESFNSLSVPQSNSNMPLLFSCFVFVAAGIIVLVVSSFLQEKFTVISLLIVVMVALLATMTFHLGLQWEKMIILRVGKFHRAQGPGLFLTIPFFEQIALRADQRTMITAFSAEETLSADLVPVNVDAVLFWVVWDAKKACIETQNYNDAVSLAAQTALRDAIGRATISQVIMRRVQLDEELRTTIDEKTADWGVSVLSVEIRDIVLPGHLQDAMSAEAIAEREKNARIMLAEVECDIAEMLKKASSVYQQDATALKLRSMLLLSDSVKSSNGSVVIPSAYAEGFGANRAKDQGDTGVSATKIAPVEAE